MRAFSPALPPAKRPTSAWTPAALATLRQWLADNYYSSPVGGLQVIESLETHGTVRAPQPGCCALFDGANDYALGSMNLDLSGSWTITARFKVNNVVDTQDIFGCGNAFNTGVALAVAAGYLTHVGPGHTIGTAVSGLLTANTWYDIAVVKSETTLTFYLDGVLLGTLTSATTEVNADFEIGSFFYNAGRLTRGVKSIRDVRVYSTTKTAPEVAAIAACDFTNLDRTGIVAGWYFNERAGTTARDWTGNGHDLTLSGPITESTFWAEDAEITANPANVFGYTNAYNLLKQSQNFSTSAPWNLYSGTMTFDSNVATAPDGSMTADRANFNDNFMVQGVTGLSGTYTASIWLKSESGTVDICLREASTNYYYVVTATTAWQRFTLTKAVTTTFEFSLEQRSGYGGTVIGSVLLWGAQLVAGAEALDYYPTTTTNFDHVIIPRDESDTAFDTLGNALGNTGLSPYPVAVDTPCITFNGVTTDYATLTSINAGTVHTFSAWAKITADAIFLSSAGPNDYSLFFYSGEVWYRANSVTVNFAYSPPSGWAHYAVVRNGTAVKFYVNGAQVGTTQTLGANGDLTITRLAFGYNSLSVASMALHSDAKSDAEILAMFQGTENRTNLLRSWKCQEGPGTASDNVTLYDDSGNGNHLTVVGGTVADQWDNLCPGYVRDRAFEYGGRVVYGNQLAYSNFASGWTTTTTTLTVSGSTDPNGGATASKITPNSTGNTRSIYNTTTVSAKHISVCCKADGVNWINLINVGGTLPAAWFNVSTGTVGTVVAGYTATIEDLGTGWFRCRLFKDDGSPFIYVQVSITNSDNTTTVTASGSNGVLVWEPVATNIKGPLVPTSGTAITGDVFIPLVPGTLLCADGNAATIAAGNIAGNPYSRVDFDPFDAAELGALAVPGEFDSLPCVTGNGTNNNIILGASAIPPSGDFSITLWVKVISLVNLGAIIGKSTGAIFDSLILLLYSGAWRFTFGNYTTQYVTFSTTELPTGEWSLIEIEKVGTTCTVTVNGLAKSFTCESSISNNSCYLLSYDNTPGYERANASVAGLRITANGTTKYFPLTDGSGADIAMYEDGVATVISNAIQGTLTNVWANKTEGQVDHEFPEATRAIVPRDTKFTNGSTKTITTSEPAVGADLDNILGYIG